MRKIDTIKQCEFSTGMELHSGVIDAPDNHPFFAGFDKNTHYLKWQTGQLPELAAYTAQEIAEREAAILRASFAVVSPRQIRQALTAAGLRQSVEAAVAAGDQDLRDWWEFATSFERDHPQVLAMADALNVSPSQLDQIFQMAAGL